VKIIGTVLVLAAILSVVFGVGYVAYNGLTLIEKVQWESLGNDWKAILIVIGALLIACTLYLSWSIQAALRQYALRGSGKVQAYNDFSSWYASLKGGNKQLSAVESFNAIANPMILWGSRQVARQARLLHDALNAESFDAEQVMKKADGLYLVVKRDIGISASGDRSLL